MTKQSVIGDSVSQTAVEAMSAQPQDFRGIGEEDDVHADPEVEKMRKEILLEKSNEINSIKKQIDRKNKTINLKSLQRKPQ